MTAIPALLESHRRLSNTVAMNKVFRLSKLTPYSSDYALWCAEQGALLREGRLDSLDRENLAEEIESLGSSQEDELESRMEVLLLHLLKWQHQPDHRSGSWKGTILEQRGRILRRIRKSPSLRSYPSEVFETEYVTARLKASGETGLPEDAFPPICPFSIDQILDPTFYPDGDA
jgi:hypothetical protein